jgi:glyoxylase-like metal-dependent hydrolase (beta-lactamase superfamily II)
MEVWGRIAAALLALALPVAAGAQQQPDFSKVEITRESVAPNLSMLVGMGGNIGVSTGDDGLMVIDDQYAPLHPKIAAALAKLAPGPVRFVLNTHWHPDHTGGNELFAKGGAVLVAHDNVRARLASGMTSKLMPRTVPPAPAGALPVVTFANDITFHWNGDDVHVFHVAPAHTDGDAIVHFRKADVMHTGDVFVTGRYPFIDVESGGSLSGIIAACEQLAGIAGAKTRIIPGHGALAGRTELLAYLEMLKQARDRVAKAIAAGKTVDQVAEAKPMADYDATWGTGFINPDSFVRLVYMSLSKQAD